ncbi:fatty acid-binding protein, liver-like [Mytilus edulis]|uniref:fatty acid-binding protein, liver-like n=1 Tax=Mytilus edulis TaxID=6550 RepID=UPI0039EE5B82
MTGLDAFVGSWQEQSKEGFDEMASALGLPADKVELYKAARTAISYGKDGDGWVINVGLVGVPGGREFKFQVGQPYDSADIDGSPMKSLVNVDNGKLVEQHTNQSLGAEMNIERWIEGGQMHVKTSCSGLSMLSKYAKV